jgi:prenyltransferase beta subunit
MPNFKPKTNKKIKFNKKSVITLDTKHKEFLNEFNKDDNNRIPELKFERNEIKQKLVDESNTLSVEQRLDLQDKVNEITKNIKVRSILSENIYMNDRLRLINNNLPAVLKYNNTKGIVDEQLDYIINEITMVNSYEPKK